MVMTFVTAAGQVNDPIEELDTVLTPFVLVDASGVLE